MLKFEVVEEGKVTESSVNKGSREPWIRASTLGLKWFTRDNQYNKNKKNKKNRIETEK